MEFLLEPLEYEFFRHALLAAFMIGASSGLIGVYVVLRGMSYVGHGLSHAAIGGAIVGITLNLNFYTGACAMGLLAALIINKITANNKIKLDAKGIDGVFEKAINLTGEIQATAVNVNERGEVEFVAKSYRQSYLL